MDLRPDDITEIIRIFDESELVELRIELGVTKLYLSKSASPGPATDPRAPTTGSEGLPTPERGAPGEPALDPGPPHIEERPVPAEIEREPDGRVDLLSPLLGVFYRRPSPDQPPFVEVGVDVEEDDPVCIIDVMKMFTRVPAGVRGRVAEICVADGALVEHGQVLMRLDPR